MPLLYPTSAVRYRLRAYAKQIRDELADGIPLVLINRLDPPTLAVQATQTVPARPGGSGLYYRPQRHEQCNQDRPGEHRKRCYDKQRASAREAPFRIGGQSQSPTVLVGLMKNRHPLPHISYGPTHLEGWSTVPLRWFRTKLFRKQPSTSLTHCNKYYCLQYQERCDRFGRCEVDPENETVG